MDTANKTNLICKILNWEPVKNPNWLEADYELLFSRQGRVKFRKYLVPGEGGEEGGTTRLYPQKVYCLSVTESRKQQSIIIRGGNKPPKYKC